MLNMNDVFCYLPFMNIRINSSGRIAPCCIYDGHLYDNDDNVVSIQDSNNNDIFHNKTIEHIRNDMLNNVRPTGCHRCFRNEDMGVESPRQRRNRELTYREHVLADITQIDTTVIGMDIAFGNTCNLKCVSCNLTSSSKIAAEKLQQAEKGSVEYEKIRYINKQHSWIDHDKNWQKIMALSSNIKYLDIYGGEPFLIKKHTKLLEHVINIGISNSIKLHYNTNGTIYPSAYLELWKSFEEVNIGFSIDNVGRKFEIERYGGDWQEVDNNIRRLLDLKLPNLTVSIMSVVHNLNIMSQYDLYKWIEELGIEHVHLTILGEPQFLNLKNLPPAMKEDARIYLENMPLQYKQKYNVPRIIDYLNNKAEIGPLEILKSINYYDNIRENKIKDSHSHIIKYLK